jgi:hypothetical protein
MERIALRHILGIYGRTTKVGEKPNPFRLLWISLRMLAGSGSIPPLRDELSKSTFEDTEKSLGIPMGEAALTFERYLQMHLTSMGFFGRAFYERSYIEGLNALILTYPLLCWFSRAIAAAEGQSTVTKECAEKALMIVDHQHGLAPKLISSSIRPLTLFLSDRAILRSLAIWYGS